MTNLDEFDKTHSNFVFLLFSILGLSTDASTSPDDIFPLWIHNLCYIIGLFATFYYLVKALLFLNRQVFLPKFGAESLTRPTHFRARYGRRSFAVVTAGSDGIGRAFCLELARLGFRIIVISRSVSKLEKVCAEINDEAGQDRTGFYVSFDFSTAGEAEYNELFRNIDEIIEAERTHSGGGNGNASDSDAESLQLQQYQRYGTDSVAILVNNVGINYDHWSDFIGHSDAENCRLLKVNCEPQLRMTHHFYKRFMNRIQNSSYSCGIVDLASISGYCPIPLGSVYAGTKAFNGHFNRSLALEHEGVVKDDGVWSEAAWQRSHVDFVSVWPGFVATGMTHTDKPTWQIATPRDVATRALQQMVIQRGRATTPGSVAHFPMAAVLAICPSFLIEWFVLRQNRECAEKGWVAPGIQDRSAVVVAAAANQKV